MRLGMQAYGTHTLLPMLTAELSVNYYAEHRNEEDRSPGHNGSETILSSVTQYTGKDFPPKRVAEVSFPQFQNLASSEIPLLTRHLVLQALCFYSPRFPQTTMVRPDRDTSLVPLCRNIVLTPLVLIVRLALLTLTTSMCDLGTVGRYYTGRTGFRGRDKCGGARCNLAGNRGGSR